MADDTPTRSGNPLAALLAAATAILAVAVAVLVLWPPNGPDAATIAEAVSQRLEKDGYLKKDHFDQRMDRLIEAAASLLKTEDFERGLDDLKRALASCCGATNSPTVGLQPRIWVVFENARLDGDKRLTAESHGVAISGRQRERLDKLAQALIACAAPDRPVRLKIQGYSSTREFVDDEGQRLGDSDGLNLQAANLRAEGVKTHFARTQPGRGQPRRVLADRVRRLGAIQGHPPTVPRLPRGDREHRSRAAQSRGAGGSAGRRPVRGRSRRRWQRQMMSTVRIAGLEPIAVERSGERQ